MTQRESKKIFSPMGLVIISCLLVSGLIIAFFVKKNYSESVCFVRVTEIPSIKKYRIGFVTDAHSKVSKNGSVRSESKIPMLNFVSEVNNNFHPDFVVDGGDFIDGTRRFGSLSMKDYSAFSKIFETIKAPKYKVLGNHELRGMTRETWIELNGYENSYYHFDYDKLRVIILDSNLIPANNTDILKNKEYEKELFWLEELLKNSEDYKKIVFSHHPLVPVLRKSTPIERITELNNLLNEYGVRAVFSGHVEVPHYEKIGKVDYFVIPGFYRSKATGILWEGSFSEIGIGLKNSLKLFYKREGENDYRTLTIPSAEYEIVKKEIMSKVNFLAPTDQSNSP